MKSRIWYEPPGGYVDVELDAEKWAEWLAELFSDDDALSIHSLGAALSRFHLMLKATPDDLLEKWPAETRKMLAKTAMDWADRLEPELPLCVPVPIGSEIMVDSSPEPPPRGSGLAQGSSKRR